jgi:calcium-dependent protein kinase
LSREELIEGYTKIYGEFAEDEVDKIMKIADIDGSGEIDYSEWLVATVNKKNLVSDDKLKNAFEFFDKDCSGSISISELKQVLGVKK